MSTTATAPRPTFTWNPTSAEVDAIVIEMRPIIDRCVERDLELLRLAS